MNSLIDCNHDKLNNLYLSSAVSTLQRLHLTMLPHRGASEEEVKSQEEAMETFSMASLQSTTTFVRSSAAQDLLAGRSKRPGRLKWQETCL